MSMPTENDHAGPFPMDFSVALNLYRFLGYALKHLKPFVGEQRDEPAGVALSDRDGLKGVH